MVRPQDERRRLRIECRRVDREWARVRESNRHEYPDFNIGHYNSHPMTIIHIVSLRINRGASGSSAKIEKETSWL